MTDEHHSDLTLYESKVLEDLDDINETLMSVRFYAIGIFLSMVSIGVLYALFLVYAFALGGL